MPVPLFSLLLLVCFAFLIHFHLTNIFFTSYFSFMRSFFSLWFMPDSNMFRFWFLFCTIDLSLFLFSFYCWISVCFPLDLCFISAPSRPVHIDGTKRLVFPISAKGRWVLNVWNSGNGVGLIPKPNPPPPLVHGLGSIHSFLIYFLFNYCSTSIWYLFNFYFISVP